MSQIVSIIVALVLVTPLLFLRVAGRPVNRRTYGVVVLQLAASATVVSTVVCLLLWDSLTTTLASSVIALVVAGCAFVMLARSSYVRWQLQRFVRDVLAVRSGGVATEVERITDFLMRNRPGAPETRSAYANHVLFAVAPLVAAQRFEAAERLLEQLPSDWLSPNQRATYANALVVARFARADVAGAKKALDERPREIEDAGQRRQLELFEALFASLAGEHERALALLASIDDAESVDPILPHLVRAHALAARGDEDGARAALAILKEKDAVSAAITPAGPASKLVAQP